MKNVLMIALHENVVRYALPRPNDIDTCTEGEGERERDSRDRGREENVVLLTQEFERIRESEADLHRRGRTPRRKKFTTSLQPTNTTKAYGDKFVLVPGPA